MASVSVTRGDGTLTASWSAPAGATKYHITYSSDGKRSWSLAAAEHGSTSITISGAKNESGYVVGVRAGNAHGWSGWRNSASAGPYTPPPTLTPPTTPPGTPASVYVSRSDGALTARWDAPSGATRYHITYSSNGGGSWTLAAYDHATNSIAISGVENGATYIVGVRAGNQQGEAGYDVQCTTSASTPYTWTDCHSEAASLTTTFYVSPTASGTVTNVRLRAREGHRVSLWSAVTSVPSGAPPVAPGNLAVSVTTQSATVSYALSWDKPSTPTGAVAYVVQCSDDNQTTWTQCATVAETTNANLTATPTRTTTQTSYTHLRVRADQGHLRGPWSGISTNTN